jgi:hypothetical protein
MSGRDPRATGADPDVDLPDDIDLVEERLIERDRSIGDDHDVTATGLRRGESLDERLAEEDAGIASAYHPHPVLGEGDAPDHEAELLGTAFGETDGDQGAAEEAAVHVVEDDS